MADELRVWLGTSDKPHFVLPPREAFVVGCLDEIADAVCRNAPARELVARFVAIAQAIGPDRGPTLEMLRVALEYVGLGYETEGIDAFCARAGFVRVGDS